MNRFTFRRLCLIFNILILAPLFAQTPNLSNGVPAGSFAGEQFCFDLTVTNTGTPGFGPYVRLILEDGLTFDSATFLGTGVTTTDLGLFPISGTLADPVSNTLVSGAVGDRLILLRYPVGSVVAGGPDMVISVCATIATSAPIGTPLRVNAQAVYEFGDTATGVNGPIEGVLQAGAITPTLFTVTKSQDAPESERPPGTTWPITYTITVDVANGQTLENIAVNDILAGDLQYTGGLAITGGAGCSATTTPSLLTPGGTLTVNCSSITGTTSDADMTISYSAHVIDVLDESNCATSPITNTVTVDAEFPASTPLPQASATDTVTAKHLAIQKSAAPGTAGPGDTVTFTLNLQVGDFATASDLVIVDVLPDGYTFTGHQSMTLDGTPTAITPATVITAGDDTQITYDIHAVTGNIAAGSAVVVSYTATVNQFYASPSEQVLAADTLTNQVVMTYDLTAGASSCTDDSSATVSITPVTISKSIVNPLAEYVPGDTVTFRISMTVPSGDTDGIVFEDFLPLPVFDATLVDTTFGNDVRLGPNDNTGLTPTAITTDGATNSVRIQWPEINTTLNQVLEVDLDVTVVDEPFADDLFLTNLCQVTTINTEAQSAIDVAPVSLRVRAPVIVITKGVSASDNATADATISPSPATLPVDGNISASDAGDTVTFVITVENTGGAQAHDVTVTDTLPSGLTGCSVTSVVNGNGIPLANSGDLFGAGLVLTDPLAGNDENPVDGGAPYTTDTALITCQCTLDTTVAPRQVLNNSVAAVWSSLSGATAFSAVDDATTVTIADPAVSKSIDSISPGGAGANAAAGDEVTYRFTVTLPEGTTPTLVLTDQLPAGFEFLSSSVDTTGFAGTVDTSPTVGTSGTVDAGQTVTLTFDSPANTTITANNNAGDNRFDVTLTARANGSSPSNDGLPTVQNKTNSVALSYTGITGATIEDTASVNFAEPELSITKTMSPDTGLDAGDTVTVTLQVDNNGTAPAYDLVVTDVLNDDGTLFDGTTVLEGVTPAGYTFNYANPTVTFSADGGTHLAAGASVTFTFTAEVLSTAVTGSSFTNQASVTGDSQDGTVTEERATNDTGSDSVSTQTVASGKALTSSSESWTSDTAPINYAIGEVLTFTGTFDIPEGLTRQSLSALGIISDTLPAGFQFVTGSATIRAVADSTIEGASYGGALPSVATSFAPLVSGQDLFFQIGDITNNDSDAGTEQIIISYDVLVLNTADTNRTDSKTNTLALNYRNRAGTDQSITSSVTGTIAESNLSVTKTATPSSVSGGSTVTFTVVVTNTAGTNVTRAWEITGRDNLPARFQTPALTAITLSRGGTDVTACGSFSGNQLDFDMTCLAAAERYLGPGESLTFTYNADIDPSIGFNETVTNTFDAAATSLPGANGTGDATPGAADSDTGERTGSGNNNSSGQNVNDLTASGSDSVTAGQPTITKTGDASLAIGATTNMTVTVDVPIGTTDNFVVTDNLPSGLTYTGTAISITTPPTNFSAGNTPSTTPGAGTDPLVFDFGSITNSSTGVQQITIVYEVSVDNVLANQNTTNLTNTASLSFLNAAGTPSDTATITVVEPNLDIVKTVTAGATGSEAGDTISYQVVISNTAPSATAFRLALRDQLPDQLLAGAGGDGTAPYFTNIALANPGNNVVLTGSATPLTVGDAVFDTTTQTDDTLTWPLVDMPPAASLTITYDAVLVQTATAGATLVNSVTASYDGLPGGGGRDGSSAASDDDNDADLNNYNESDTASVTLDASIAIQKTLSATEPDANYAIGEVVSFDLRVDVVQGLTTNVTLTDLLPSGLDYVATTAIVAGPNIAYDGAGSVVEAPAGTLTLDMGDITNTADADNTNDFFIFRFTALVEDVVGNSDGTVLINAASLTADTGAAGPDTQSITVVEPNLTVTKVPDSAAPSLGDTVTWTVTVSHSSSNADAFEVVLTDAIPTGLTYVVGSTTGQASVNETDPSAPIFDLGTITLAETSKSFTFQTTVDLDATVGSAITNNLSGTYSSLSGNSPNERTYNAAGSGTVTPGVPTVIDAVKTVAIAVDGGTAGVADPGDTLEYTVVLTNQGDTAQNVVFTDRLPAETTYVAASLGSTQGITDDGSAPDLSVDVGTLNNSDTVTITFQVTVNGGTPAGTVILNQGSVDSDQTVPEPTDLDGIDENGDQPTPITVGGPPAPTGRVTLQKVVSLVDDADASGDITPGDRMRYLMVITNVSDTDLTNVSVTDTLPAGLTYVAASAAISGGNTINVVGSALTASVANLSVKGLVDLSFEVTIDNPLVDFNGAADTEIFSNQAAIDSDQTDPGLSDNNGDPRDGNQPTTFVAVDGTPGTPIIDAEKRWFLSGDADGDGLVDPGDRLTYTIAILNDGSAEAVNVRLTDTIPINTTVVAGTVTTSSGIVLTQDPVSINIGPIATGSLVTVTFDVTVNGGTPDGTIIANQATVTGDNFTTTNSDDNGRDDDGINPTLTPVDSGGGSNAGTPSGLAKSVFATSEAGSSSTNVFIGEVITYRITIAVPAGILREATLTDTLPIGLGYVAGSARLARLFDTGLTASSDPAGINGANSGTFVDLVDGADLIQSGANLSVFLGDLINSDNDGNAESFVLEVAAVVENAAGNQAGTSLVNGAGFSYFNGLNQLQNVTPVSQTLTVIEPNVQTSKSASPTTLLVQGGTIQFTVTLTNPAGANVANAYDLNLTDSLPPVWDSLSVDSITPSGGAAGITDNTAGTTLDIEIATFPVGAQLVVVYSATDAGGEAVGTTTNTATARYTSLPGTRGTGDAAPGNSGESDGERNGSGSGANDFLADDSADVTIGSVQVTKSIPTPQSRYAVGDLVTYQVTIDLPQTTALANSVITDVLDEGLTYVTGSLVLTPDAGVTNDNNPADFSIAVDTPAAGQTTLTLNLGTLTNSNNAAQGLTLSYQARIDNLISVQTNATLTNSLRFGFDNPAGGGATALTDTQTVTVGEPSLTLVKTITGVSAGLDAGDSLGFQIQVGNTGTTTAYEVVLVDVLPSGFTNITNLVVASVSGGAASPNFTNNGDDWLSSGFDIPPGGLVTITFEVVLADSVIPGETLQNTVTASYSSRDGSDADERDGSSPGSVQNDDSDLNNYNLSAGSPTITVADPLALDKRFHTDPSNADYTIGEQVGYRLTLSVLEGSVNNLMITDTLPSGLRFESALVGVGNIGMTHNYTDPPSQAGQVLSFDLGTLVNPANGNSGDDVVTIDITATVLNQPGNIDGTVLGNHADVSFSGPSGTITRDFDADAGTPGVQPLDLTLVEPVVTIQKSVSDAVVPQNDVVVFTLLLDHEVTSNADAFDLEIVDTLPVGLTYVSGSASIPVVQNGQQLTFNIAALTLVADQTSFTYAARVDGDQLVGVVLTNNADVQYSSRPGIAADERAYGDNDNTDVTVGETTFIEALKTVALAIDQGTPNVAEPGDTLEYTVVLTNGAATAENVLFTDTLPALTTYVATSLTSDQGTVDDSAAPTLQVAVGSMAPAQTVTIRFRVTINPGVAAGTVILNQGLVNSDQTVGEPTDVDGVDGNGDQPTPTVVGGPGDPSNPLRVQKVVAFQDDTDANGAIGPGDRMRYSMVVRNDGGTALTNVVVTDTIPSGLTYVTASAVISGGHGVNVVGDTLTATISNLAPATLVTLTFDVTIDNPLVDFNSDPNREVFTNQALADSDQTDPEASDSNGDPSDGNQPTRFSAVTGVAGAPDLDIEKRRQLAVDGDGDGLVDPGDTLLYQITLVNIGAADAENLLLTDTLPPETTVVSGSATSSRGVVLAESPLRVNIGDVAPGEVVTLTVQVTVNAGTADGTILVNQAFAAGDNVASTPSDDNGNDDDGLNPTLVPVAVDGGGAGSPSGLAKNLHATTESGSSNGDLLIGEIATYRVVFEVPAGTLGEVTLYDQLPNGLAYLAGSARLSRQFDLGLNASRDPAGINAAAPGTFVSLVDGDTWLEDTGEYSVFLGDLINSDNDLNAETYTLEYRAFVENVATNAAGSTLVNRAGLRYRDGLGQERELTPVTVTGTVHEAGLVVDKQVSPGALLPSGGTLTYTLTIDNPNGVNAAPAYNLTLSDIPPTPLTNLVVVSAIPSGGVSGVVDNTTATGPAFTIAAFPVGGRLVIQYRADAPGPLTGNSLTNTATLTWTSLPGANGTGSETPGNPGDRDGERTGSGGVNDLTTADSAELIIGSLNLTKTRVNPSGRAAVGDQVDYRVTVSLPAQATVTGVVLRDVLDAGLTYQPGSLVLTLDPAISPGATPADFIRTDNDPDTGRESLQLDLVSLANSANLGAELTLTYSAVVDNLLSNQNNQSLRNQVRLTFDDPGGGPAVALNDESQVTVGEPHLALTKTTLGNTTGLAAGDALAFQVVVGNDGTTTAFNTVLRDSLPAGLENVTALSVTAVSGGAPTPALINNGSDWQSEPFDLPVGGTLTLEFSCRLTNAVIPGQVIQNRVTAEFESRNDRSGRDQGPAGTDQDDDRDLNNYRTSGAAPQVIVEDPVALDKTFFPDATRTTYTIGEQVGYRVTVAILEGVVDALTVVDTLPSGMRFLEAQLGLGNTGIQTDAPLTSEAGGVITVEWGQVRNPANGDNSDDFLTIDITAVVENVLANQAETVLTNNVSLQFNGPSGLEQRDFDRDAGTPGNQGLPLTLVEPELQMLKSTKNSQIAPGQAATFNLILDHTAASGADAFDILIVDRLPEGLTYVPSSGTPQPEIEGTTLIWRVPSLSLAQDQISLRYQARVAANVAVGIPLENRVDVRYASLNPDAEDRRTGVDGTGGLNDYVSAEATATLIPAAPVMRAEKSAVHAVDSDNDGLVEPGDRIRYIVTLHNDGTLPATSVVFDDDVPFALDLIAGSVTTDQGTVLTGNTAGDRRITVDVGEVLAGSMVSIQFDGELVSPLPRAVTQLVNQGTVRADNHADVPTDDPDTPETDDPTVVPVAAAPRLAMRKSDALDIDRNNDGVASPGDIIGYTLVLTNSGNQDAGDLTFTDIPDRHVRLVTGTVTTTAGTIEQGNLAGDDSVRIAIPTITGNGGTVTISFQVQINDPLPDGVNQVVNQATLTSPDFPGVLSDDPDLPGHEDPTATPLDRHPILAVSKSVALADDADNNGIAGPGERIRYTVTVTNRGNGPATSVVFRDTPDPNAPLVPTSVTTDVGSVTAGNDGVAPIIVTIPSLAPAQVATIRFDGLIVDPLPTGITHILNQGFVSGDGLPDVPSDDPELPGDEDPTLLPVDATPILSLSKRDVLLVDSDQNGIAGRGDALLYQIRLRNDGNTAATGVLFQDTPDALTLMSPGSLVTDRGQILSGNDGVPPLRVAVGELGVGEEVLISFEVTIRNDIPDSVVQVANQAVVTSDQRPPVFSDDPDSPPRDDETVTPLQAQPRLDAFKSVTLAEDADGDGIASAGDTLAYRILIQNTGHAAATQVRVVDYPDANGTLVTDSVITNTGSVITGNDGIAPVTVTFGDIPAGGQVAVSYRLRVNNPLPEGVNRIANQGLVGSDNHPDLPTDDPETPAEDDPTVIPVDAAPRLTAVKTDLLSDDRDNDGHASPGDVLLYRVVVRNVGNQTAENVVFSDTPDRNTTFLAGSVVTDRGNVLGDGTLPITVALGDLPVGAQAVITFSVIINNPLPTGLSELRNQGQVSGDNVPAQPTDDPDLPGHDDPTVTPVGATPVLLAEKTDALLIDRNQDGLASAGDRLSYQIRIRNLGTTAATGVVFTDHPDAVSTLVAGTVQTTRGEVRGGFDGGLPIDVLIGDIAAGDEVLISFHVDIPNPLPGGVRSLVNQGTLDSDQTDEQPTDDPDSPGDEDPTVTPVDAAPLLDVVKTVALINDADGNGIAGPGDRLRYAITVRNSGSGAATELVLRDTPDANTLLVPGSVRASQGIVTSGNTGSPPLEAALGVLAGGGAEASLSFEVTVVTPLPIGVDQVANQALVTYAENTDPVLSDDPATDTADDPTVTPVAANPRIELVKTDSLVDDRDGDGFVTPGDDLGYTLTLTNSGNQTALAVVLSDLPDANTTLANGSVITSTGTVTSGNNAGDTQVVIALGDLPPGAVVTITFNVTINQPLAPEITQVRNQALASGGNFVVTPSDDPDLPGDVDPTDTPLNARPLTRVFKVDSLTSDLDGDGFADPGDGLTYQIQVVNTGRATATGLVFRDFPDSLTSLLAGSVTTDRGSVIAGNDGNPPIDIQIGDLPAGAAANIRFQVQIQDPLPAGITRVANQAVVVDDHNVIRSDDPDLPGDEDPTVTPVGGEPHLLAEKQDFLFADNDNNGLVGAGDDLLYRVVIRNVGNGEATGLVFTDTPDDFTHLIPGLVATSQGEVVGGNDGNDPVVVRLGTLAAGALAEISFAVRIDNPLPDGVSQVVNQGVISGDAGLGLTTDDPDFPGEDDPTVTPLADEPLLRAEKRDLLWIDSDDSHSVTAGDTLLYRILISNDGRATAADLHFSDTPDPNTSLVPGSVTTTHGTVTAGNDGNAPIRINLGDLPAGEQAAIAFQVQIHQPLPDGTNLIRNQGLVEGDNVPDLQTDDPDIGGDDNPTDTPLAASPRLQATKVDSLAVDADANGGAGSGDTLLYVVRLTNSGTASADNVVFRDFPDPLTRLVDGSVRTDVGTIEAGNDGRPFVQVHLGNVAPGAVIDIRFRVTVNNDLPAGTRSVANQGLFTSDNYPGVLTDDPDVGNLQDPTVTPLVGNPRLIAEKIDRLVVDADNSGGAGSGDTLEYRILVRNLGDGTATNVVLTDTPDIHTQLVPGSITTDRGTVSAGNDGIAPLVVNIGALGDDESAIITFRVTINDPLPPGTTHVANQAVVSADGEEDVLSDDPDVPGSEDETETPLDDRPVLVAGKTDSLFIDANGDGVASPGDTLLYQILVVNLGRIPATGVVFTDTPSPVTQIVAGSIQTSQGVVLTGQDTAPPITVAVGTLPADGGLALISFQVVVDNPLPVTVTEVVNQGVFTTNETDSVLTDDPDGAGTQDATPTLVFQSDMEVIKTAPSEPIVAGTNFVWDLLVRNNGPSTASRVVLRDPLPAEVAFASATPSQGSCRYDAVLHEVICDLGVIALDRTAAIALEVTMLSEGSVTNTAFIEAVQVDPDGGNNDDDASVLGLPGVDLELTKTVDPVDPDYGETVVFTVVLRNTGQDTATGIQVADQLPAGLRFASAMTDRGTYDAVTGLWTLDSLAPDESVVLTMAAVIEALGVLVNEAEVTAVDQNDIDSTPANGDINEDDQDRASVSVDTLVDLVVTKTNDQQIVPSGTQTLFEITVQNLGPSPASQVLVREFLPDDLQVVWVNADVGDYDTANHLWHIGNLGVNETVTLSLLTQVRLGTNAQELINRVVVESFEPDGNESNNEDTATILILEAIPTLGEWALFVLLILMAGIAMVLNRRMGNGPNSQS